MYKDGKGVERDSSKAAQQFNLAAAQGHQGALNELKPKSSCALQ
jgi:TPR repeat protein